jgi:hypothetical protein
MCWLPSLASSRRVVHFALDRLARLGGLVLDPITAQPDRGGRQRPPEASWPSTQAIMFSSHQFAIPYTGSIKLQARWRWRAKHGARLPECQRFAPSQLERRCRKRSRDGRRYKAADRPSAYPHECPAEKDDAYQDGAYPRTWRNERPRLSVHEGLLTPGS